MVYHHSSIEQVWSKSDLTKSMTLASGDLTPLRVGVNARAIVGGFFKKKVHHRIGRSQS